LFYNKLKVLDISNFNINKLRESLEMFTFCSSLENLNISNLNLSHVYKLSGMFIGCSKLKELNVTNFITNNIEYLLFGIPEHLKKSIIKKYKS